MLLYGHQCVSQSKKVMEETEKLQSKLLKSALSLKRTCKSTPLLDAMKVPRIGFSIRQQEITLLKNCMLSNSRIAKFYNYMLRLYLNKKKRDGKNLFGRVMETCKNYNLSFVKSICEKHYVKNNFKPVFSKNDGLYYSSLQYLNKDNREMMNALLSPF